MVVRVIVEPTCSAELDLLIDAILAGGGRVESMLCKEGGWVLLG